jgi:hypothetical protein
MDVPSHTEVVEQIDAFLSRHDMAPSRLGRDALSEPQFVSQVRKGRLPSLTTLGKLFDFMRSCDRGLTSSIAADRSGSAARPHRLNAEAS